MLPALAGLGTSLLGSFGSALGSSVGGGGAPMPGDAFAPTAITFGSVNFKSAGAGDRGKSATAAQGSPASAETPAAELAGGISSGPSLTPPWLAAALAVGGVLVAVLLFIAFRRR